MQLIISLQNMLEEHLTNPYILGVVKLLIILYSCLVAPKLPVEILAVFDNTVVKILVLVLIFYSASIEPMMAILLGVGLFITLQTLNNVKLLNLVNDQIESLEETQNSIENAQEDIYLPEEDINLEEDIDLAEDIDLEEEDIRNVEEDIYLAEEDINNAEEDIMNAEENIRNAEEDIRNAEEGIYLAEENSDLAELEEKEFRENLFNNENNETQEIEENGCYSAVTINELENNNISGYTREEYSDF